MGNAIGGPVWIADLFVDYHTWVTLLGHPATFTCVLKGSSSGIVYATFQVDMSDGISKQYAFNPPIAIPASESSAEFLFGAVNVMTAGQSNYSPQAIITGFSLIDATGGIGPANKLVIVGTPFSALQCTYLCTFTGNPPVAAMLATSAITLDGLTLNNTTPQNLHTYSGQTVLQSAQSDATLNTFVVFNIAIPVIPSAPGYYTGQVSKIALPSPVFPCECNGGFE